MVANWLQKHHKHGLSLMIRAKHLYFRELNRNWTMCFMFTHVYIDHEDICMPTGEIMWPCSLLNLDWSLGCVHLWLYQWGQILISSVKICLSLFLFIVICQFYRWYRTSWNMSGSLSKNYKQCWVVIYDPFKPVTSKSNNKREIKYIFNVFWLEYVYMTLTFGGTVV